jgi:hypothetical protein
VRALPLNPPSGLLDLPGWAAALDASAALIEGSDPASPEARTEEDGAKALRAFIEGFHLTDGCMDAMNAALSGTFAIYDDPEAGTDLDGDSVTVLDRLRDYGAGYAVIDVRALQVLTARLAAGPIWYDKAIRALLAHLDTLERRAIAAESVLAEIAEGTGSDRIGRYDLLRDWVHTKARSLSETRAALEASRGSDPASPVMCQGGWCNGAPADYHTFVPVPE